VDSFCWGLNGSGEFTTKSATWLAHGSDVSQQPSWQFKWIWHIKTMPKIKIFLWQVCHNALPIRGILFRRGCHIEPQCPLCTMDMDSIDHLFWNCYGTQRVWDLVVQHQRQPAQLMGRFSHDWTRSFGKINELCSLKEVLKLNFLLWTICKGRNAVLFQNEVFNPIACIIRAK